MSGATLTANAFQTACLRTWQTDHPALTPEMATIANAAISLSGEVGELLEHVKKVMFHGQAEDLDAMRKEAGDVLYYLAVFLDCYDMTMEDAMQANIDKLQDRHPDGYSDAKYTNSKMPTIPGLYGYDPAPVSDNGNCYRDFG